MCNTEVKVIDLYNRKYEYLEWIHAKMSNNLFLMRALVFHNYKQDSFLFNVIKFESGAGFRWTRNQGG